MNTVIQLLSYLLVIFFLYSSNFEKSGFYIPFKTSSSRMGVPDKVRDYFSMLIDPLASKENINTFFYQF